MIEGKDELAVPSLHDEAIRTIGVFAGLAPGTAGATPHGMHANPIALSPAPGAPRIYNDSCDFVPLIAFLPLLAPISAELALADSRSHHLHEDGAFGRLRSRKLPHSDLCFAQYLHATHVRL